MRVGNTLSQLRLVCTKFIHALKGTRLPVTYAKKWHPPVHSYLKDNNCAL